MTVLDASVFIDSIARSGREGDRARKAVRLIGTADVPSHFKAEATAGLRRMEHLNRIDSHLAREALLSIKRAPVRSHDIDPLLDRVWELRDTVTVYDAWYVALAERLRAPLVTADQRLAEAPGPECEFVVI